MFFLKLNCNRTIINNVPCTSAVLYHYEQLQVLISVDIKKKLLYHTHYLSIYQQYHIGIIMYNDHCVKYDDGYLHTQTKSGIFFIVLCKRYTSNCS